MTNEHLLCGTRLKKMHFKKIQVTFGGKSDAFKVYFNLVYKPHIHDLWTNRLLGAWINVLNDDLKNKGQGEVSHS